MSLPLSPEAPPPAAPPLLSGQYRSAYVRSTRGAMWLVAAMALGFVWAGVTGFMDGWVRWVALGMGPYLLYVNWTTAQLLRQPPQVSAEGLTFMEHDPLAYRAVAHRLRWDELRGAQWQLGKRLRRIVFHREGGEAVRLTLSSLENEDAFCELLSGELAAHDVPQT